MTHFDDRILSVDGLRVEIPAWDGTLVPVRDISFDVAKGEVVGVVGESGAGKSVTAAAIIGLIEPPGRIAAGEIRLGGQRIDNLPEAEFRRVRGRRIGSIFQDPMTALDPLFTIGQQLTETIHTHLGVTAEAAHCRAVELLEQVGLPAPERCLLEYPHQLSGGMRQRVVIALALCADPELVVADEPTTALDVSVQAQIIDLIRNLCRARGTAVMLVTHDMGVIAEVADRVAVMYAGRIVEIGAVRQVLSQPRHPYTQGLMASIPRLGQRQDRLVQIDGAMPSLSALPAGCAFHPRCTFAADRCRQDIPPLFEGDTGAAACWKVPGVNLPNWKRSHG